MKRRAVKIVVKIGLSVASLSICLMIADFILARFFPVDLPGMAMEIDSFRQGDFPPNKFIIDPEFGFRPALGTDYYNDFGTLHNNYSIAKIPGKQRLLFIGDSVTARGRIVEALAENYGDNGFEYWNAGVESFNTIQEAAFYLRYNHRIKPDHVILTFHSNDFQITPIAFRDSDKNLVVYAPKMPVGSPWLFLNSAIYRLAVRALSWHRGEDKIIAQTEASLAQLAEALRREGILFTVLLHPFLETPALWDKYRRRAHEEALRIFKKLNLRHFDLLDPFSRALDEHELVQLQQIAGDPLHPSKLMAKYYADYLKENGLLAKE